MAGKRKKGGGGSGGPGPSHEAMLAELEAKAAEVAGAGAAAGPVWGQVHKLLLRLKADPAGAGSIVMTRDLAALRKLIAAARQGEDLRPATAAAEPAKPSGPEIPPDTLKEAMRAFRRRFKLVKLDHESRINVNPLTSGKAADFQGILPPLEYPEEVWRALAEQGQLERMGQGFYKLPARGPGDRM